MGELLVSTNDRIELNESRIVEHAIAMAGYLGYELDSQVRRGYMTREAADTVMAKLDEVDDNSKAVLAKELLEEATANWGLQYALDLARFSEESEGAAIVARTIGQVIDEYERDRKLKPGYGVQDENYFQEAIVKDKMRIEEISVRSEFIQSKLAICATCTGPRNSECPMEDRLAE